MLLGPESSAVFSNLFHEGTGFAEAVRSARLSGVTPWKERKIKEVIDELGDGP